jgi:hypothetical protein
MQSDRKPYPPLPPEIISVYGPNIQRICVCANVPLIG